MEFKVQIAGLNQIIAAYDSAPAIVTPILEKTISAAQAYLAKYTGKENGPWRTGFLMSPQNWRWGQHGLRGAWSPTASYAKFVEFGTAPHLILPKDKKALYWSGAANPVKVVNHPGTVANDFMGRVRDAATPDINSIFGRAVEQIIAAIAEQS